MWCSCAQGIVCVRQRFRSRYRLSHAISTQNFAFGTAHVCVRHLRVDRVDGTLLSTKKLKRVLRKVKFGKGSPDQITAVVLKELPPDCLGKTGKIAVRDVLGHELPRGVECSSLTVMAPTVLGATTLATFRPILVLCAMRKVMGYIRLNSLSPLRYESVQTAFVPKTRGCWVVLAVESGRAARRALVRYSRTSYT